ncbi:transglutaminase domain-containing protein [Thermococcus sp. MV11]|uniref:transglutaminase domain-containing protein n=1 Tax=Thermococcus sp. MV11 TaxID=1638267 RepID=UPI001430D341|nr:transglutaminase domain-containing protein [Thermococcus sp. MV11]NJE04110.1 transglutaminase domain-containing protein [Thermococcus sp. MV11]
MDSKEPDIRKVTLKYALKKFTRVIMKTLMAYVVISLVLITIPQAYKFIRGDKIMSEVLDQIGLNTTNPNELALRIYSWEQQNFANPYFVQPENMSLIEKLLAGYGFYHNNQGELHLFRPFNSFPVPPQWVLHSKLANCEEYAKVFVYLMNQEGVKARIVRAPGEDHTWAEYYVGNYKIIFDPSNPENPVIVNPKQFGQLKNFSYVEAYDLANPDHKEDVSDEYIERGTLVVKVVKGNEPVSGATVEVLSTYLMERFPERYDSPRRVVVNETGKEGTTQFKLGPKEYKIVGKKCSFPVCWRGESTGKVIAGSITYAKLELGVDYVTTVILWALIIIPTGVLVVVIHKRYVYQRQQ